MADQPTITVEPEPEPVPVALANTTAQGIAPIQEIEALVKRAEYLGEKLDHLRRIAVARTFPSDWIDMGGKLYLEGDGGLRMAPVIGLMVQNVKVREQVLEDGVVRVTYSCDAGSALFGTRFEGIERTRRTDDGFLKKKSAAADIEDVRSAAHKGMIAKAAQFCAGLTGLTAEELKGRYGITATSKVEYKTGQADAKRSDQKAVEATGGVAEIHRILRKISMADSQLARQILVDITKNDEKGWVGKQTPEELTEKGIAYVVKVLQKRERDFDAAQAAEEGKE